MVYQKNRFRIVIQMLTVDQQIRFVCLDENCSLRQNRDRKVLGSESAHWINQLLICHSM